MERKSSRFLFLIPIRTLLLLLLSLILICSCNKGSMPPSLPTETLTVTPNATPTITPSPTAVPLDGRGGGVIAYSSWERNEWQIYRINADGSGQTLVTAGVKGGYEPSWSPDGSMILFQYTGLWIANLTSGEINRIPLSVKDNNLPNEYIVKPSWSPDGQWIAFLNESGLFGDLYLIHPDGSDLIRITSTNDISRDGNLVWSSDSTQIAFSSTQDGNLEIYTIDVEEAMNGNPNWTKITESESSIRNLVTSWSPDGTKIAFSSDLDGNTELYLVNPDGSNLVRLTDNPYSDTDPNFSPDGKLITFLSNRDGDMEVYVLNVENAINDPANTTAVRITNHKGNDAGPKFQP